MKGSLRLYFSDEEKVELTELGEKLEKLGEDVRDPIRKTISMSAVVRVLMRRESERIEKSKGE